MNTSLVRVVTALIALTFIVAGCASDTGAQWTYAPVVAVADDVPDQDTAGDDVVPVEQGDALPPGAGDAQVPDVETAEQELTGEADPAEAAQAESGSGDTVGGEAPAEGEAVAPAGGSGEPRVIELVAVASLQFQDPSGQQVTDIPVTPGETIVFSIDNTSGFEHNFYIGTDEQLSAPSATTETGIPNWTSGIQELEWTVPDDVTGLKFGCTVPGHYALMQGTFSASGAAPAEPAPPDEAAASPEVPSADAGGEAASSAMPEMAGEGQPSASGESRVVELVAVASLQFQDPSGQQVTDIPVTPGETIVFSIDNTSGFEHNFYIGTDEQLSAPSATTETGIPNWTSGVQELEWTVPDDVTGLKFGCTVPGHYALMQGTFSVSA